MAGNSATSRNYIETLREMCVECIVCNFDIFMTAYKNSNIPAKYFEFLQRTHSKELFEKLYAVQQLDEQHISFLINPYLKELNLSYFSVTNPEQILERLTVTGKSIKLLCLNDKVWDEDILLKFVAAVPSVETLLLRNTVCSDNVMKSVGELCPHVSKLDVSSCMYITNEGVEDLFGKDDKGSIKDNYVLHYLDLTSTNVSDDGVFIALKHAPSLRTLHHDHVAEVIYDRHATDYVNGHADHVLKYQLTSLQFYSLDSNDRYSSQTLAEVVQVCSAFCPLVTSLKVDGELDESVLSSCARFTELKDVQLSNVLGELPAKPVHQFLEARGNRLLSFDLKNSLVSLRTLSDFCRKLHTLTLRNVDIEASDMPSERNCFLHLRELTIEGVDFAQESTMKAVIFLVSNSPKLEILSLPYSQSFSANVATRLTQCKCMSTLRCIDASFSDLNADGASRLLLAAPKLHKFLIEQANISDDEYYDLLGHSLTRYVHILWRGGSSYTSDDDDMYNPYDFDDYYDNDMGYSDDYGDYDTDYSDEFLD